MGWLNLGPAIDPFATSIYGDELIPKAVNQYFLCLVISIDH